MKIGVACYPTFGGSGVVATELGIQMARRGHEVHFFSYAAPVRLHEYEDNVFYHQVDVSVYPLFKYPPYDVALACRMAEVIESHGLDLLHVHYAIPHAVSAYLARQMLPGAKVKIITTLHGTDITLVGMERSYFNITKFGIEQSDGVTAVSRFLKEQTMEQFSPEAAIEVIPNFVDPEVFCPRSSKKIRKCMAEDDEKIIMHVSNFRPVKRVQDVILAFNLIRLDVPSKLILIGEGEERSAAERLVRERGLEKRVRFLGNREGVAELLSVADLFVLPSDYETFGLAALEAMACGVVPLSTNKGGPRELIEDGVDGMLCDVGDPACLADKAVRLLKNPEKMAAMRQAGLKKVGEKYTAEAVVPLYEKYYEKILAR